MAHVNLPLPLGEIQIKIYLLISNRQIREDNFRFWWRRVHEDASQGM